MTEPKPARFSVFASTLWPTIFGNGVDGPASGDEKLGGLAIRL